MVCAFYQEFMVCLRALGIEVTINTMSGEVRIRFMRGKQSTMLVSMAEKEQIRQDVTRGF